MLVKHIQFSNIKPADLGQAAAFSLLTAQEISDATSSGFTGLRFVHIKLHVCAGYFSEETSLNMARCALLMPQNGGTTTDVIQACSGSKYLNPLNLDTHVKVLYDQFGYIGTGAINQSSYINFDKTIIPDPTQLWALNQLSDNGIVYFIGADTPNVSFSGYIEIAYVLSV